MMMKFIEQGLILTIICSTYQMGELLEMVMYL